MRPSHLRFLLRQLLPFGLSAICAFASYLVAGPTAGLFFSGFVLITLLCPALLLRNDAFSEQLLCTAALIAGIIGVWSIAIGLDADLTTSHVLSSSIILVCYAAAI